MNQLAVAMSTQQAPDVRRERQISLAAVVLTTILGGGVRLVPALTASFPLNDGGLFYTMAQDLQHASYAWPWYTSYNAAGIPFAYPPLPFYLVAVLNDLTGWPLLDIFRLLPALVSTLTIPAFYLFARTILRSRPQVVLATLVFALLPWSFFQGIKGGGLTRAPALLLVLLLLGQVYLLYTRGGKRAILLAILLAALTILSHPEVAVFAAYSAGLFWLFYGRHRRGLYTSLLVLGGVIALTAPWWLTVLLRYGPPPVLAAFQTRGTPWYEWVGRLVSFLSFDFTGELYSGLLAILGLLGFLKALARREFFFPIWLVVAFVLIPHMGEMYAMVPLAVLAGLALDQVVLPAVSRSGAEARSQTVGLEERLDGILPKLTLTLVVLHGLMSGLSVAQPSPVVGRTLLPAERAAMVWVQENTAADSTFLVVTDEDWWKDAVSEWFPALSQRVSQATPQGYEWVPGHAFERRVEQYMMLQSCADQDVNCLEHWAAETGLPFSHVYIAPDCCRLLSRSLEESPGYVQVYARAGATIFVRRPLSPR